MKFGRDLYWAAGVVVACSMLIAGLLWWHGSAWHGAPGGEAGARYAGVAIAALYVVGAVGVIWLGWYWFSLAQGITSMAERLHNGRIESAPSRWRERLQNGAIVALSRSVSDLMKCHSGRICELQEQVKDVQLQLELAQRRERNTEAIIHSIHDAVIVVDGFDKLVMANEAAERLLGFGFTASQFKPIRELITARHDEFAAFLSDVKAHKAHASRREMDFVEDEQARTFDCVVSCVYDDREQVCGAVAVLHDITKEREIQQMKNDFVSHVSHELKTPLASIMAYAEMLADGEADDEKTRKEFYGVIQSQAERLNRLIEDILNVSRIESGLIKVNKEPASMTMLIEEQMQMIEGYAEEKGIEIVRQKPIVFDQVRVDKDMMSQVIVNLLSNAVKYTPAGGTVRIETQVDESACLVRVSVSDTGYGIPEEEVGRVFDKFYRVKAHEKHAKGSGLGLNLVKQIVEKVHNGRVFVRSKVGEGSTFGFELPLANKEMAEVA